MSIYLSVMYKNIVEGLILHRLSQYNTDQNPI